MPRRRRVIQRKPQVDRRFGSLLIEKFINKMMMHGKKGVASRILYRALDQFAQKVKEENPLVAFEAALTNAKPSIEVKSRRIGGSNYQVPVEIPAARQLSLAIRWIITHSRSKPGKSMEEALTNEFTDCYNNQGSTIKKKEDTHRMAEANKAFAHYKW